MKSYPPQGVHFVELYACGCVRSECCCATTPKPVRMAAGRCEKCEERSDIMRRLKIRPK